MKDIQLPSLNKTFHMFLIYFLNKSLPIIFSTQHNFSIPTPFHMFLTLMHIIGVLLLLPLHTISPFSSPTMADQASPFSLT